MQRFRALAAAALSMFVAASYAHEGYHTVSVDYSAVQETAFGRAADPQKAARVVRIEMSDRMRFDPSSLVVQRGEIVRFVPVNNGTVMHEMVLGTRDELARHAEAMKRNPAMHHEEPYMAHVLPGHRGEMGWQFTRDGEFYFGCLVPGHFEAGMVGKIVVKP
jgi:uncharacterized cupredoxin-like copper-binding protein